VVLNRVRYVLQTGVRAPPPLIGAKWILLTIYCNFSAEPSWADITLNSTMVSDFN